MAFVVSFSSDNERERGGEGRIYPLAIKHARSCLKIYPNACFNKTCLRYIQVGLLNKFKSFKGWNLKQK